MRLLLTIFILSITFSSVGQVEEEINFSDAVRVNLSKFRSNYGEAIDQRDTITANMLFDSLVAHQLVGTKFNYLSLKKVKGGRYRFKKSKKPIIIITYANWIAKGKGEVQAINKIAREHHKKIDFVFLYWDTKEDAQKASKKFNGHVIVCYAHDKYRNDQYIVKTMKKTLGFPRTYFIDENKKVIDIKRGFSTFVPYKTPLKKAKDINYDFLNSKYQVMFTRVDSLELIRKSKKKSWFRRR
jgi:thiol-disulfide isomerase/thioredoxin